MAWLVTALGALLLAGGATALWNGSNYIRLDWGQAETVAGTVALSGGAVTLALAAVLFTLRGLRPAAAGLPAVAAMPTARPEPAAAPVPEPTSEPIAPEPAASLPPPLPAEAPTVVGRYEANGATYVLFSDGTIEVETEHGTHRFASMQALRDHIERPDGG